MTLNPFKSTAQGFRRGTVMPLLFGIMAASTMVIETSQAASDSELIDQQVAALIERMTLAEKIGQMTQRFAGVPNPIQELGAGIRSGEIGSILNLVDVATVNEMQRIAVEDSRLGIPLLVGRDVIHGFQTVMPIPLGQAASFNPDIVREGARIAAREAASRGVNWTFAPMMDISRDARWGRIAESMGEDTYLTSIMTVAMIEGFQGDDLSAPGSIAACAKHFAGYGASESGRDYSTTNIPENELRNVYLPPFHAAVNAGVETFMTSFSDLNGVPATGNSFLFKQVLREEWGFNGFVVSDWDAIRQLAVHGLTAGDNGSAYEAVIAGVDMEMQGDAYQTQLAGLVESGKVDIAILDNAVASILRAKFRLGLFENPYTDPARLPPIADAEALAVAKKAAMQSIVLLKNDKHVLPLSPDKLKSVAIIGPLADAPYEQLGTWVFDGDEALSVTPLAALRDSLAGKAEINYVRAMETSRSRVNAEFDVAVAAAKASDVALLFLGEESILSGEAHSRADISLPGDQAELVRRIRATGTKVVAVILAGRPLTLTNIVDEVDAIMFAWHPGTMGGPAIAELLTGVASPSAKLPATFPRMVGQIPIYYNQKNSGKPPEDKTMVLIDDIEVRAAQTSFGMSAFHLDAGYKPLFAFGHGLSYTEFEYSAIRVSDKKVALGKNVTVSAKLKNTGDVAATEIVQLYVRDLVGNVTRPIKELKGFKRVHLEPGQSTRVEFVLSNDDLAFYGRDMQRVTEAGEFHVWIGGSSETELQSKFTIVDAN